MIQKVNPVKGLNIRAFAKLIAKLEAAFPGIQYGRTYMWYLHPTKATVLKKTKGSYDGMHILEENVNQ